MRIYHYTNIETLALILKNRTIRFNRLDHVDDLEEGRVECSGIKLGQYIFVSCWTEDWEESIPLWRMYTEKGTGVRISLPKEMFKTYAYNDGDIISGVTMEGNVRTLMSPKMFGMKNIFILPCFNEGVFYRKVQYVQNVKEAMKDAVKINTDGSINFRLSKWGAFKNSRWKFQNESRFVLTIYPKPAEISTGDELFALWLRSAIQNGVPNTIEYYDLELDANAINSMEITLCPNMSDGNKILVESLCSRYIDNKNMIPKESALNNFVKLK